ncbi:MAG: chromosome segregation protein SMC [Elusimicrobiota bacterium]
MYLKSIDIVGYKSFALKTHVDLEPGITGIIGPNGCGKSNIMESVRWCLGEMSWKSLRADHMTDVIFAGTAKRPALSMTEVTLTFDNAASMLPVQFSEVTISRRIFRSGESAYFLNKTQCRLRDIRELFLDTGLGGDGYAIIDQGGVDAMISAKPEERRAFFEEAAGVAKYKAKREEALRKLERVEMDMGRLQDSVSLIDEQVKKLDSDARKAKLYKKYKEELSAMEAAHILEQVAVIEGDLAALALKVGPLEETLGIKRVEMNAQGAHLSALNLEKANQQNQALSCNQKIADVKSEIGRLEERLTGAAASITEMETRAAACALELAQSEERLSGIGPEIERASDQVRQAEETRAKAQGEVDSWNARLSEMTAALRVAEQGQGEVRRRALQAVEEKLSLERGLSKAESSGAHQEQNARARLRELDRDLSQVDTGRKSLESLTESSQKQQQVIAEAQAAHAAAEAALLDLRRRQTALNEETLTLHSDLAGAKARSESLEAQGGQNPYWVGAQACLNAGIEGVVGTVRSLIKVDEAVKPYLEDVLGERLYAVVCEHSAAARAGVEFLQAAGRGRARFLVLSSLPASASSGKVYPEEARPLLQHVQCDPKHDAAVRFLLEESYAMGKVLFGDHWVYGGSAAVESLQLSLSDVGEVKSQIAGLEARRGTLSEEGVRCASGTAAAETLLRQAASALSEALGAERALKAQLSEKEETLGLHVKNVELSTGEAARVLAEMALTKEEVHLLRAKIAAAAEAASLTRQTEDDAAAKVTAAKEDLAKGHAGQELLTSKLESYQQQLSFLAGAYERLAQDKTGLEASVERRRKELSDLALRKDETLIIQDQSRQQLQVLGGELATRENEAKVVFDRLQDLEKDIAEREKSVRALKLECDAAQTELHQHEISSSNLKTRMDVLRTRLWDDWQLAFEEARAKFTGQVVDTERMDMMRKRIAGMGNINMAAPEEYEALAQKQTFLTTQINDLNAAKEDLKAAISKINGTTRENFRQTFIDVREHFRRLYGVLFEGGEADLVLTDPENILETGIDIVAQPPGKRLQSISLLSGGEKTLTAIALLFAFFMVKPSPFCMLDEADAALDDANVERFVSLLKEFQSRSQFLIVSHNKRTMEAADVIYGVTMEEMGVSQLISVDFRKKASIVKAEAPKAPETHGPFEMAAGGVSSAGTAVAEAPAAVEALPETMEMTTPGPEPVRADAVVAEAAVVVEPEAVAEAPVALESPVAAPDQDEHA